MPFTTSHPAIILPLKRIWPQYLSLSGLMAGAMSPDLLYFLMMGTTERSFSHSWPGLVVFCIPAGVVFTFAFHWLFKRPFLRALPAPLDRYFSGLAESRFSVRGRRAWLVLIGSVAIGALSHFFWDSWTHATGVLARQFPPLLSHVSILGRDMPVTTLLQHLSTLLGTATILGFLVTGRLIPKPIAAFRPRPTSVKLRYWAIGVTGSLLAVILSVEIWCGGFGVWSLTHCDRGTLIRSFGLGSWAGFFWATSGYTVATAIKGAMRFPVERYDTKIE
ncbi:DUF4184 family protein [candidate division GN15 bacterium]|nr:DUF4184 family protein [candidate division GN15 bacterium]